MPTLRQMVTKTTGHYCQNRYSEIVFREVDLGRCFQVVIISKALNILQQELNWWNIIELRLKAKRQVAPAAKYQPVALIDYFTANPIRLYNYCVVIAANEIVELLCSARIADL